MQLVLTDIGVIKRAAIDIKPLMILTGEYQALRLVADVLKGVESGTWATIESTLEQVKGAWEHRPTSAVEILDARLPDGRVNLTHLANTADEALQAAVAGYLSTKRSESEHPMADGTPQDHLEYANTLLGEINQGQDWLVMTHSEIILRRVSNGIQSQAIDPASVACTVFQERGAGIEGYAPKDMCDDVSRGYGRLPRYRLDSDMGLWEETSRMLEQLSGSKQEIRAAFHPLKITGQYQGEQYAIYTHFPDGAPMQMLATSASRKEIDAQWHNIRKELPAAIISLSDMSKGQIILCSHRDEAIRASVIGREQKKSGIHSR